jgi:hypothetical protein
VVAFSVLSARVANAQSVLAYASLADLLEGTPASTWADLPDPQRIAMDRVLLRDHRPARGGSRVPFGHRAAQRPPPCAAGDR